MSVNSGLNSFWSRMPTWMVAAFPCVHCGESIRSHELLSRGVGYPDQPCPRCGKLLKVRNPSMFKIVAVSFATTFLMLGAMIAITVLTELPTKPVQYACGALWLVFILWFSNRGWGTSAPDTVAHKSKRKR